MSDDPEPLCSVRDCACGGKELAANAHDTGFRFGTAEYSCPIIVSTAIPADGWLMLSGDWKKLL